MKKIIIYLACWALMLTGHTFNVFAKNSINVKAAAASQRLSDNTLVRVLIAGVWWIFVYAPDGSLITAYIDVDDHH
jgi:hypothetical protein